MTQTQTATPSKKASIPPKGKTGGPDGAAASSVTKELAKPAPSGELAITGLTDSAWGSEEVTGQDILIPKILVMQGLSKFVTDEKIEAKLGEFRNSISGALLGGKDKPLEILAFHLTKSWLVFEEQAGKMEYMKQEPMTPANSDWPLEEVLNGVKIRRDRAINAFCLLPHELGEGGAFPYVISFRRTSHLAGKKLATEAAKLREFKKPLAYRTFLLSSNRAENDQGVFFTMDIKEHRTSTESELKQAFDWYKVVKRGQAKIDESDVRTDIPAGEQPLDC